MSERSRANRARQRRDALERDPERSLAAMWAEMYGPHNDVAQALSDGLPDTVARLHAEWLRYLAAGAAMTPPRGRELTGYAEHVRDMGYLSVADEHSAWHSAHGRWGCPWDCAWSDDIDAGKPAWRGVVIDSANYCPGYESMPF